VDQLKTAATESATEMKRLEELATTRLRVGTNWKRRTDTLNAELETERAASAQRLEEATVAKARAGELEKEITELKGKVEGLEKRCADLERGNTLKDGTVARLQSELTSARGSKPVGGTDTAALVS
jgi:predicted nuclease with TOPRIM domain